MPVKISGVRPILRLLAFRIEFTIHDRIVE
jgi:hypothetical protein